MLEVTPKVKWKVVRFDQMAIMVNDRIDNPSEANVDRYIGLEHLDSDSLRIRRWGSPSDVEATKLLFRSGDIIFGRRRAYQRKLAVADFDGICSAHAMVLRAQPEVVLPEFLPFFMQSDLFMERAKEISVGSLSPTINWKTLAKQEFALPPREEQSRIAELLNAVATLQSAYIEVSEAFADTEQALMADIIARLAKKCPLTKLGELADVKYGLTVNPTRRESDEQAPYLRVANVLRGRLDLSEVKTIGTIAGDDGYRLSEGDVLIVEGHANRTEIGRAAVWAADLPKVLHQNHLIRARCGEGLDPRFLCLVINSPHGQAYFQSRAKSSSGLNTINSSVVKDYELPTPDLDVQETIVEHATVRSQLANITLQRHARLAKVSRVVLETVEGTGP